MKNKKLSLVDLKITSFITDNEQKSLKGGDTQEKVCLGDLGSLYPTKCCITEYPTHPCNTGVVCTVEIQG